jgi:hypothetical protein
MGTSAYVGQAVGMAAAVCARQQVRPAGLTGSRLKTLQTELIKTGQHIPGLLLHDEQNLVHQARLSASSELILSELPPDGPLIRLHHSAAQMLPFTPGPIPKLTFWATADEDTTLTVELRRSSRPDNHTPDVTLETKLIALHTGKQAVSLHFEASMTDTTYAFICFGRNKVVSVQGSQLRITGLLSVFNKTNPAVSNYGRQEPTDDIGVDAFEFWTPERRPNGHNIALRLEAGLHPFAVNNIHNGIQRPTNQPNAWVADPADTNPTLTIHWDRPKQIREVVLHFDTDFDHPLESVLMTHPETVMPFCVRDFVLCNDRNERIYEQTGNYLTRQVIRFNEPVETRSLSLHLNAMNGSAPASLLEMRCYE